jgi:hypothetical protein
MSDDIFSPPYPTTPLMKPVVLYHVCEEFFEWVKAESACIHEEAGMNCCQQIRALPKLEQFLNLGFLQHAVIWLSLRSLREAYDHIVRSHDDNWNGKASLRLRHMSVQQAIMLMEFIFLPREVMEARVEAVQEGYMKKQQGVWQSMVDMMMGKKESLHGKAEEAGGDNGIDYPDFTEEA